ncbi:Histone chaperone ASF1B [Sarcoptes scabiei]|uniref:Histone chaperone ASF1A n=2 Tax=Sarcoptes scabiei TaxID=52283 RepID=A0A834R0U2_SARSC|nr:Histone chaperone ASF1B [Sarcoptes scabiei]UXI16867.1 ADP-ribosylation factor-related protein 1 [Sarcoptes scabiei]
MAKAQIVNIVVLDNPSLFYNPFQFEITFECIEDLKNDLEWKIIYVGSAESEEYDQVLDTVFVGPVPEGRHMFVFQANAPDPSKIPVADAVGVTVVLLTCSYLNKEFVRVGYYVNNEYTDPELRENPPSIPQFDKLQRNILATDPRITKFKIDWGEEEDSSINSSNISEAFPNASNIDNLEFKQNGNGSLDNSNCFISEDSIGPLNPVTIIDNSRSMEI